jgi:hypothetical protein
VLQNQVQIILKPFKGNSKKMKKRALIILLFGLWISPGLMGQNTQFIINYFPNSKQIMEEYYSLIDNENIKHGEYIQYFRTSDKDFLTHKSDYISKKGFYFQNQPDSVWLNYNTQSGKHWIAREEHYKKGKKYGIWKTYIVGGAVIKRFDYDLNKEIEPEFRAIIPYPALATEMQIQGVVKVKVIYKDDCTVGTISIVQSVAPVLDKNAIKCVSDIEKLRTKYSLKKDCTTKRDSIYTINYKLNE